MKTLLLLLLTLASTQLFSHELDNLTGLYALANSQIDGGPKCPVLLDVQRNGYADELYLVNKATKQPFVTFTNIVPKYEVEFETGNRKTHFTKNSVVSVYKKFKLRSGLLKERTVLRKTSRAVSGVDFLFTSNRGRSSNCKYLKVASRSLWYTGPQD